jgi:hypothetical protein
LPTCETARTAAPSAGWTRNASLPQPSRCSTRTPGSHCTRSTAGINPIIIRAYYGAGAHDPHLQGGTAGDRPLNVFDENQAAAELPTLRAIASADLHNLVFQRDYRIIPAIMNGLTP